MWQSFKNRLGASVGWIYPDPHTRIYGVWGYPIQHSLSPQLHNRAFRYFRLKALYLAFSVHPQDLAKAVEGAQAFRFSGWNLTIPHKEAIIPYLDLLSPEAQRIGAVNTVVLKEGRLKGYNTDAPGFILALRTHHISLAKTPATIVGTGGAGRAVAFALAQEGVPVLYLVNRTRERAEQLWGDLKAEFPRLSGGVAEWEEPLSRELLKPTKLLVHCTSRGLGGSPPLRVDWEWLPPEAVVFDLVYDRKGTQILREAKARGFKVIGGEEMLVAQAALAFELWTGKRWDLRRAMRWFKEGARQQEAEGAI